MTAMTITLVTCRCLLVTCPSILLGTSGKSSHSDGFRLFSNRVIHTTWHLSPDRDSGYFLLHFSFASDILHSNRSNLNLRQDRPEPCCSRTAQQKNSIVIRYHTAESERQVFLWLLTILRDTTQQPSATICSAQELIVIVIADCDPYAYH